MYRDRQSLKASSVKEFFEFFFQFLFLLEKKNLFGNIFENIFQNFGKLSQYFIYLSHSM